MQMQIMQNTNTLSQNILRECVIKKLFDKLYPMLSNKYICELLNNNENVFDKLNYISDNTNRLINDYIIYMCKQIQQYKDRMRKTYECDILSILFGNGSSDDIDEILKIYDETFLFSKLISSKEYASLDTELLTIMRNVHTNYITKKYYI